MMFRGVLMASALLLSQAEGVQAADVAAGQKLARTACVNCHFVADGVGPSQPTAGVPGFRAIASKPGQTGDKIKAAILSPHPPMPGVQLTVHELDNVAAYILSLKKN